MAKVHVRVNVTVTTLSPVTQTPPGYDSKFDKLHSGAVDINKSGKNVSIPVGNTRKVGLRTSGVKGYFRHLLANYILSVTKKYGGNWDSENVIKTNYTGGTVLSSSSDITAHFEREVRLTNPIADMFGTPVGSIAGHVFFNDLICEEDGVVPVAYGIVRGDPVLEHIEEMSSVNANEYVNVKNKEVQEDRVKYNAEAKELEKKLRKETDPVIRKELQEKLTNLEIADVNQRYIGGFWAISRNTELTSTITFNVEEAHIGMFIAGLQREFINHTRYGGHTTTCGLMKWELDFKLYDADESQFLPVGTVVMDPNSDIPVVIEGKVLDGWVSLWKDSISTKELFEKYDFKRLGAIEDQFRIKNAKKESDDE